MHLLAIGHHSLQFFALVLAMYWIASFVFFHGIPVAKQLLFPLAFLFLAIPLPTALMARAVAVLQQGSADTVYFLFKADGIPVYRQGFQFALPGVDIRVADECSGIRSSTALFVTATLAGHLFLRSGWTQLLLSLLAVPIAIFKNAVRIFTISWLGVYVNAGFLHGRLHRYGGLPFSVISVGLLLPLLFALRRCEASNGSFVNATPNGLSNKEVHEI